MLWHNGDMTNMAHETKSTIAKIISYADTVICVKLINSS